MFVNLIVWDFSQTGSCTWHNLAKKWHLLWYVARICI